LLIRLQARSTLFPYTTLFRSTWIGGFYDDADYDDVVLLAMSLALALGDLAPPPAAGLIVVAVLLLIDVKAAPLTARLGASSRARSEEHTSELQSRFDLVCRLL